MADEHREQNATITAEPEPIQIDVLKTAVIVVDMQNAFVKRGGYFDLAGYDLSGVERIVGPCRKIITAARQKGAKIIYFQMGCSPDFSDRGPADSPYNLKAKGLRLIRERPEVKDKFYIYGLWGAEIIEELKPKSEDLVVKKQKYDGFIGTNLEIILSTFGIRYLIFVGTATNLCVESTLFFLGLFSNSRLRCRKPCRSKHYARGDHLQCQVQFRLGDDLRKPCGRIGKRWDMTR
jgi:ureidoacrylate peracid hydrolase